MGWIAALEPRSRAAEAVGLLAGRGIGHDMMDDGMVLGLIPARGGSKGVPGKNLRKVGGVPLIARALACAERCSSLDRVVVSTDSEEIADLARRCGGEVPFLRPAELASDTAPMLPVMRHAIESCESIHGQPVSILVLLDVTGALRLPADVEGAIECLITGGYDAVVSAAPAHRNPYFNMVQEVDGRARLVCTGADGEAIGRRQDAPVVHDLNTVVWVYRRAALMEEGARLPRNTGIFRVPAERALDLDTEFDFRLVEHVLSERDGEPDTRANPRVKVRRGRDRSRGPRP